MDPAKDHEADQNIADAKASLRQSMSATLANMNDTDRHRRSVEACRRLVKLDSFQRASYVMLYMPLPTEVDLTPAALSCFQQGRQVCVPMVDWNRREMRVVEATSFDDEMMDVDDRGIRTPRDGRPVPLDLLDVIVVPGLAFDDGGHRLGRGGGFYDRFLRKLPKHPPLVGLAFDDQVIDAVPVEPHDFVLNAVVTDRRVAYRGKAKV